ncbi:FAD-dependent oxidoreductase [Candidatus Gottesmanbacteria bacterium]|nr:FAD-dependent oxidoreductase [Candidatus Gottesmanbacteria bacterium]
MMLTLKEIRQETAKVSTFVFWPDSPLSYRAGQHVSIRLGHENSDNRGTIRTFSLSSSPTEQYLTITTNQGESSFKKKLFSLRAGAQIEARGPGGGFILRQEDPGHHIMIAGGIGITPFRSMLKYASDTRATIPITLLYSNRTPEEIVFRSFLDSLTGHITIIHTITHPQESTAWAGRTGRIDETTIAEFSKGQCRYYVCGPLPFVEAMVNLLGTMGIPIDRIHYEKFTGYSS